LFFVGGNAEETRLISSTGWIIYAYCFAFPQGTCEMPVEVSISCFLELSCFVSRVPQGTCEGCYLWSPVTLSSLRFSLFLLRTFLRNSDPRQPYSYDFTN